MKIFWYKLVADAKKWVFKAFSPRSKFILGLFLKLVGVITSHDPDASLLSDLSPCGRIFFALGVFHFLIQEGNHRSLLTYRHLRALDSLKCLLSMIEINWLLILHFLKLFHKGFGVFLKVFRIKREHELGIARHIMNAEGINLEIMWETLSV